MPSHCCVANYDNDTDLQKLLDSTSLAADLAKFFEETPCDATVVIESPATRFAVKIRFKPEIKALTDIPPAPLTGSELFLNEWGPPPRHIPRGQRYSSFDRIIRDAVETDMRQAWPELGLVPI